MHSFARPSGPVSASPPQRKFTPRLPRLGRFEVQLDPRGTERSLEIRDVSHAPPGAAPLLVELDPRGFELDRPSRATHLGPARLHLRDHPPRQTSELPKR